MTVGPASSDCWERTFAADTSATFFNSPAWYALWERYGAYVPRPLLFEWPDGTQAVLPLARERRYGGLRTWWHSSPAVNYGGLLCESALSEGQLEAVAAHLRRKRRLILRENPYSPNRLPLESTRPDQTFVVDLRARRDMEALLLDWRTNQRRNLQKSRAHKLQCTFGSEVSDWGDFAVLYEKNQRFRGDAATTRYRPRLFDLLRQLPGHLCALWTLRQDGAMLAAYAVFYVHAKAFCWLSAADPEQRHLHLYEPLYHHIIADAADRGLDFVDLNPSGGIAGVEHFKKGLGTTMLPANIYVG
jgi:CelD/BcsL family acetyltransferase involved in cellulose biosynthesis